MVDQCIVCLETLDGVESAVETTPHSSAAADGALAPPAQTPPPPTPPSLSAPASAAAAPSASAQPAQTAQSVKKSTTVVSAAAQTKDKFTSTNAVLPIHPKHDNVAQIEVCGHVLHDLCLREWIEKANSCPICRQNFHLVHVYDKIGGTLVSSYSVEDKKQVADFDLQTWLDENPEEEEDQTPCVVCNLADNEEVLLLCDSCDTPYHTHCIGLSEVPRGHWFCVECSDQLGPAVTEDNTESPDGEREVPRSNGRRSYFLPRTQATMRRARQHARSDEWQGAWGRISGQVWNALNIDLDYQDDGDDDEGDDDSGVWETLRRSQQLRERERQEYNRWQQRLNIASRLGARDVFESHMPVFNQRIIPAAQPPPPESRDERKAWGALEKARECEGSVSRKRKSRSTTAEPGEQLEKPERKLKRPRTRRLPVQSGEPSSSKTATSELTIRTEQRGSGSSSNPNPNNSSSGSSNNNNARPARQGDAAPSFLSSLLKEVEMSTPSDEENIRNLFGPIPGANDASSPAASPTASGYSSPRASSITPPPYHNGRPGSPTLTLSSHIEPIYPRANYSPSRSSPTPRASIGEPRSSPENSDSEQRSRRRINNNSTSELRQPQPRRGQHAAASLSKSKDVVSPAATTSLSYEMKENISNVVRSALKPHWKSSQLTSEQYANINRDVSRKLYEQVSNPGSVDDEAKRNWETIATREVARAIAELKA